MNNWSSFLREPPWTPDALNQEHTGFGRMAAIHDAQASLAGRWVKSAALNGKCAIKMLEPSLWTATCLKSGRSTTPNPKAPDVNGIMLEVTGQH